MKSFNQFLTERNGYQYLFHGTSSVYKSSIQQHGLRSDEGTLKNTKEQGVYLTTDFHLAVREAGFTVKGENGEEGAGGRPVVVVVDRTKVTGLRRDSDYHMFGRLKDTTAFITPNEVSPGAIIEIVPASSPKYRDANSGQIVKQVGITDKDGNPIVDLDGNTPEIRHSQKLLKAYTGTDGLGLPEGRYWSTNPESDSLDGYKYKWLVVGRPEEFGVIDQLHGEVMVEPIRRILNKAKVVPKNFS